MKRQPSSTGGMLIVAWIVAMLEGFDLSVYGVTVPSLIGTASLGIGPSEAGHIGSLVGLGMLVGAGVAGAIVHRVGPRRLLIFSTALFSAGMLVSTVAVDATWFSAGRLIVGLGLGVVMPTLNAYVADLSVPGRRSRHIALMMSGYAAGAMLAPLLGAMLLPESSFRLLYVIGVVPALIAVPLLVRLPESPFHLRRSGQFGVAAMIEQRFGLSASVAVVGTAAGSSVADPSRWFGVRELLVGGRAISTALFWAMSFCGLLLVFGISAWLPSIMRAAGYSLGSALLQTAAMWSGVFVGVIVGGRVADALGPKRVVVSAFLVGTVSLVLMSLGPATPLLFALMFISGFGFIGSQILGNAFILTTYPDDLRSSGLAWALSVGRLGAIVGPTLGAFVLAHATVVEWNFYTFAVVGLIGATAAASVPRIVGHRAAATGQSAVLDAASSRPAIN
ncbi:MFS transporter [Nocardia sp. NBC_01730]|uniref:MFS transporter n=1 Tax=Nocardia sp. NBC_01730 TaxID=2975998 RepID=UPI002E133917|nr:MFS transporter [Nocardia sp. NBC_01730]